MEAVISTWALSLAHLAAVAVIGFRVIMRKPAVGVALAWLVLVSAIPGVGAVFYLLVGERRVSERRARRIATVRTDYTRLSETIIDEALTRVDWSRHRPEAQGMDRLGTTLVGVPTVAGSSGRLVTDSSEILRGLADDIDAAETGVLLEFYIWNEGGLADGVVDALERAARRGVSCRVLVDAIGSRPWLRGKQPERLRAAGVQVRAALPTGLWQVIFARNDLRLHRKIAVIDGRVAWTGSMNLVDPRYFKQDADVGQWVDAMVRVEGAVVAPLALTIISDWLLESRESIDTVVKEAGLKRIKAHGDGDAQVIPSGPVGTSDGVLQMLLALINSAHRELVLTTPYFVPDDSLLRALRGAAGRGVDVHLILPEKVDSFLTRYAGRSYLNEMMEAGVSVHLYQGGLLHTKSATADRSISMFGTANLDMRSLWLNYEVSLFVYGRLFGEHLHALQETYMNESHLLDPVEWSQRPLHEKVLENFLRLLSPVL